MHPIWMRMHTIRFYWTAPYAAFSLNFICHSIHTCVKYTQKLIATTKASNELRKLRSIRWVPQALRSLNHQIGRAQFLLKSFVAFVWCAYHFPWQKLSAIFLHLHPDECTHAYVLSTIVNTDAESVLMFSFGSIRSLFLLLLLTYDNATTTKKRCGKAADYVDSIMKFAMHASVHLQICYLSHVREILLNNRELHHSVSILGDMLWLRWLVSRFRWYRCVGALDVT